MGTEITNLGLVTAGLGSASPKIAPELDSFGNSASKPAIVVDDAHLLFTGDFKRSGSDLVISSDDRQIVIDNYFRNELRATLASPDGAMLTGNVVESLTGEVQYAQAGAAAGAAAVIGKVSKVGGLATVVRNGVSVQLNIGDNVHKGDVVQTATNSSLVLVFVDGTVFGLAASARMVLNEMVYDPNGSSNSSLLTLVQGTITFVAGQTAKNGDMKVDTPVATMGIRGTAVLSELGFTVPPLGGTLPVGPPPLRVQVLEEPGGVTGSFVLYSKINPNTVVGQVSQSGQITSVFANGNISTQPAPPLSLAAQSIIDQTMREYFPNYTPRSIAPNGSSSPWGGMTDPFNFDPINFERGSTVEPLQLRTELPFPKLGGSDFVVLDDINAPPRVNVSDVVVVLTLGISSSSFNIANQITLVDPDANQFHDIPVPYVTGSGRIVGTSGPSASLIDFDPQTGRVSYDPAEFAFLPQGGTATFTIAFDSQSGPHTVHQTLTVTIVGVNDPPTVTSAFFTVREGGSVELVPSNFGVSDPDSVSFTFTVSNVTHGQMEIFANGVWSPTTTFTTADLVAGHVRFVHDGSNSAPTFSIQANDGFGSSAVFGGTVNFEPTITPLGENDRVFEAGLAIGSAAAGSGEFAQGTFVVADPDGLPDIVSVTINGTTFAIGNLAGQAIAGAHGILTVTAYNAVSGVANYTYQLTGATTDAPVGSETDVFTLTASDGVVTSAAAAITIEIVDDVPDAVNDARTVANATPVSGNVLANDVHPNGQPGADAPIVFLGWAGTAAAYGTFVANADGTYSYVLNTANPTVQGLDSGETLTETFGYAIRDADGDVDTAALTITIVGSNDAPTLPGNTGNPNPSSVNHVVLEAGLANGSNAAGDGELAFGNLTLADADGLDDIVSVTVNNQTVAIGNLVNHVFEGAFGTLTVTAYNATTGAISYTYRLTTPSTDTEGITEKDQFALSTSDGTVSSGLTTITVEIVDDTPNAVNDTHLIPEDADAPVVGHVLANDVHPNGQSGADTPVDFVGWNGSTTAHYGTFIANEDGSYSYVLDTTNPLVRSLDSGETLTETFAYTISDADGDTDTATLTITISGGNDAPSVTVDPGNPLGGNDAVLEAGLPAGSAASGDGEFAFGTLTLSDPDGLADIINVTINNQTVAIGSLVDHVFIGAHGTLTVTAYDATTGIASYTYQLTSAATDVPSGPEADVFTVTVSDGSLSSAATMITIEIVDDTANALNDTHLITEDAVAPVAGNVLANDLHVNGQPGADVPISFVSWDGGTSASYGTFVANLDGSYSYTLNAANPLVQGLDTGQTLVETFGYTMQDADGDIDTATLTITISGANDLPTVAVNTGNPANANDHVLEAGLATGSGASGNGEFAGGTFALADADGLDDIVSITINHQTVALGSLVNHVFAGAHGALTVTAYDAATGVASYTYRLTGATTDVSSALETDVFTLTTSDGTAVSAAATITIVIDDDAPNAVNDLRTVAEDTVVPVAGNVLANDVHPNGQSGADTPVTFVGWDGSTSGAYGTFVANADGSYSYALNAANPLVQGLGTGETLVETFAYTIRDADGDTDTATLTITIGGANDQPTVAVNTGNPANANDHVLEAGLATGSGASGDGEFASGTFALADADGRDDIVNVTINNQTVALGSLVNHAFTGAHGTLTVTAYDTATGVASYTYQLTGATTDVSSALETDISTLTTSDGTAVSAAATITIEIDDDTPNAVNDLRTVTEDTVAPIEGNVLANDVHPNGQPGADAPVSFVGWDGSTSGTYGTFVAKADGSYSYALNAANPLVQGLDAGATLVETFAYTIRDADGDTDTATLTITIGGANDQPTVAVNTGNPANANDHVLEAGLATGSGASGDGEFASGTFALADADGRDDIVNVTINNQTVALGSLVNHAFTGAHGTLTVTAYDTATGVASYTYQLTGATTDVSSALETDISTLTTSDGTAVSAAATITIEIDDDTPNAVNDLRTVTEDTVAPIEGNVLANDVHPNGQPGADAPVSFVGWDGSTSGTYGTFVAKADGSYSYALNAANPLVQGLDAGATLVETFAYTIRDADGDTDTATLTITIGGANDQPTVAVNTGNPANANDHVLEAGLATGSGASGDGEFASGTFALADADGRDDIVNVTINNQTVALGSLVNHAFTGAHGTLTVTAYDTATGVASYTYQLTGATTDVSSALETDVFTLTTSDGTAVSAAATITIVIDDDAPNAVNDLRTVAEDTVVPVAGNVLANDVHPNGQSGADTPVTFVGWDGSTSGAYGTFVANADGSYSYALNAANPLVQGLGTGETLVETFAYTIRDADGDLDTAKLTITINGTNDAPTVTNTQVWMQSDPAQQTAGTPTYPNGYPILIGTPSDIDGDSLTVTASSVPAGVYYFDGDTYVALTSGTVLFDAAGSLDLLRTLVYRPTESISDAPATNLSLVVSDGTTAVTQTIAIHEVVQNHIPIESFGANVGNSPLTSGNTQTATQIISLSQADAINHNSGALTVVVQTDFQDNPTATPVPTNEQGIDTAAGAARETEVSVYLNLTHAGTTTQFVIVADDPDSGPLVQTWSFNATTGLMEARVDADHMFVANANGDPTSMSLSNWLTSNPVSEGDTWNTVYTDDTGGHFQARQFAVEIFPNDPADPGIVVNGDPVLADQIYGTSGNDTLSGDGGDDIIDGRGGNDLIFGGSGADNFKFAFGQGNTVIGDFAPHQDHIDVSAFVAASEIDAWFASHVGESPANNADTLITLDNDHTVTLKNVPLSNLSSSDFIVQAH